jgi:hypothetical protein
VPFVGYAPVGEGARRLGPDYGGPVVHGMRQLETIARALSRV